MKFALSLGPAQRYATPAALRLFAVCAPLMGNWKTAIPVSRVDFLCQVAHLRAYALGHAVPHHATDRSDCPNCEGGRNYSTLLAAAMRIEEQKPEIELFLENKPAVSALSILQPAFGCGSSGGCTACSSTVHA